MEKQYKLVYIDKNGHQGTRILRAVNAAAAKVKFLSNHPGYKVIACGEY